MTEFARRFQAALEAAISARLGSPSRPWLRFEIDPQAATPNLWFRYPSALPQAGGYIAKQVKLELGALTNQQPTGSHVIQPMLAEVLGPIFDDFQVPVIALELERTFWEKATILHAEYHRPDAQPLRDRIARHYSDVASLWRHPGRTRALASLEILRDVVQHKSRFFAASWASYDTARPGDFHLVPPPTASGYGLPVSIFRWAEGLFAPRPCGLRQAPPCARNRRRTRWPRPRPRE